MEKILPKVTIFTDGSCKGNPGPGGWAAILRYLDVEKEIYGYADYTTNNRMEMMAAIQALQALRFPCKVEIFTDSEYLSDGYRSTDKWIANNWQSSFDKPVKNKDLWLALLDAAECHDVNFYWVHGHNGHPENERADAIAKKARESKKAS